MNTLFAASVSGSLFETVCFCFDVIGKLCCSQLGVRLPENLQYGTKAFKHEIIVKQPVCVVIYYAIMAEVR